MIKEMSPQSYQVIRFIIEQKVERLTTLNQEGWLR